MPLKREVPFKSGLLYREVTVVSVDEEARTFDVVWSTGAKVLRSSYWDGSYWEELSLDPAHVRLERLNNGAPFLLDHNTREVLRTLGVTADGTATVDGKQGKARIQMCPKGIDPDADMAFSKIAAKITRNISIGYRTYREEETTAVDESIPTVRAIDWEPYEISLVTVGADAAAQVRSADRTHETIRITHRGMPPQKGSNMNEEERKRLAEEEAEKKRRADEESRKRALDVQEAETRGAQRERERVSGIHAAVRSASLEPAFGDKLIADEKITLDEARKRVLDELAARADKQLSTSPDRTSITGGDNDERVTVRLAAEAWLFEKGGSATRDVFTAHERKLKGFESLRSDDRRFAGASLVDLARFFAERADPGCTKNVYSRERIIELALKGGTRGGFQGSSEFSVLLENVLYKSMRAAYSVQPDTWRSFCGTDTVSDFKASNRYMQGGFGELPVVPENDEYTNLTIPDGSKVQISTETRGAIIALSRQALINDDMGALTDVATRFGKSAGRTIEKAVYALLAENSGLGPTMGDGQPFFHANRANVGTGAALTGAALDADRQVMRLQKDANNVDFIDLEPKILLVPITLETAARSINTDAYDHDSTKVQKRNMQQNMFDTIVSSPRLAGTRRYLFTASKEAFKVVFLEGSGEGPTMSMEEGFRVDGTQWKARIDFKAQAFDPKTALSNAGAP